MFKSLGSKDIKVEDYTGKDVDEIRKTLEKHNINVNIEKKDVDNKKDYEGKDKQIIDQSIKDGTITDGDTIILYIPNLDKGYPDFVKEGWSVKEVQTFCQENTINLTIEYEETNDYKEGTIISQSRAADSKMITNANLTIKVAKKKKEEPAPEPTPAPTDNTNSSTDNSNTENQTNSSN